MSININEKIILELSVDSLHDIITKVLNISTKERNALIIECVKRSDHRHWVDSLFKTMTEDD